MCFHFKVAILLTGPLPNGQFPKKYQHVFFFFVPFHFGQKTLDLNIDYNVSRLAFNWSYVLTAHFKSVGASLENSTEHKSMVPAVSCVWRLKASCSLGLLSQLIYRKDSTREGKEAMCLSKSSFKDNPDKACMTGS